MKTKLMFISFLTVLMLFVTDSKPEDGPVYSGNNFITGIMDGGFDQSFTYLPLLNTNLWLNYTSVYREFATDEFRTARGWDMQNWPNYHDKVEMPVSTYSDVILARLLDNYNHGMRSLMDRPKFELLCYGQRSDYQAEDMSLVDPLLWFYSFQSPAPHTGSDMTDNGKWVRGCITEWMNAGSVVSRLRANNEQVYNQDNNWRGDEVYYWYVKPSIRIPQNIPYDFPNTQVCRVIVRKYDGSPILDHIIHAEDFKDNQHPYTGDYIENFFGPSQSGLIIQPIKDYQNNKYINPFNPNNGTWQYSSRGNNTNPEMDQCKVDIEVHWYDECNMWLDYVRVDNDIAHRLLKLGGDQQFDEWINDETVLACSEGAHNSPMYMYVEEYEINHLPCMKYINDRIKLISHQNGKNLSLMIDLNYMNYNAHLPYKFNSSTPELGPQHVADYMMNRMGMEVLFGGPYEIYGSHSYYKDGFDGLDAGNYISKIPNTLPYTSDPRTNATPVPPQEYENWLNKELFDRNDPFGFTNYLKSFQQISKLSSKPFINIFQAHAVKAGNYVLREPTVEEMKMMAGVIITYGAKGIMYFSIGSYAQPNGDFGIGICDRTPENGLLPRHENLYHQNTGMQSSKFNTVRDINLKIQSWNNHLMNFSDADTRSYRYYDPVDRANMTGTLIQEIYTYPSSNCIGSELGPVDDINSRYVQVGKFGADMTTTSDFNERYFMIVNRRCSPHTSTDCGGLRDIKIKFGDFNFPAGSGFLMFRNLNLIDLETGAIVKTFDKHENGSYPIVDLGWFEPGEAKLYKLAPTLLTGGTLVADEDVPWYEGLTIGTYDVTGTVHNGGHELYIMVPITLNFAENTGIVMDEGNLYLGGSGYLNLQGKDGNRWNGVSANNCDHVVTLGVNFKDIKDGNYGINIYNSPYSSFYYTNFDYTNGNTQAGGVNIYLSLSSNPPVYFSECNFNMGLSSMQAINVVSSPYTGTLDIGNVHINSLNTGLSSGMFISGFTGSIENSSIIGNKEGIITINSNLDLYRNLIYYSGAGGESIKGYGYSYLNMAPSGPVLLAGLNNLSLAKYNAVVDNSTFNLLNGNNSMAITGNDDDKHLFGYYPIADGMPQIDVSGNCFYIGGSSSNPRHYITYGSGGEQINVTFNGGSNCNASEDGIAFIADPGTDYADTVYRSNTLQNNPQGEDDALLQSISISSRKHDFDSVIVKATAFLNNYPDSAGSTDAVEELFYSSIALDSAGNKILPLKSYYESVILNNPDNTVLINMAFYYIQKCKVALGEYVSAMGGFHQIIIQNPYSYEGLIASWDYMSTHLLDSMNGLGGGYGEINYSDPLGSSENSEIIIIDDFDNDKFNDDDKTKIKQNIQRALINTRNKQTDEIAGLREKASNNDVDAIEKLKTKEALKEAVKIQKPRNVNEYIEIVNNDIKKVFNIGDQGSNKNKDQNNIPKVFRLAQNYPNPFNPITTIKYELPKDSKVKLVVYDLLGREVKVLVNNEIKSAGYYKLEFNMQNYASGVYFYRIEADDTKGNKFIDAKKMVLVK